MPNTTPMVPTLESIPFDLLLNVSGGCKKKCCPPPAPVQQTQIIQPPPALPQQLAGPAPQLQPSGGDQISTSVVINGQRQA